MAQCCQTYQSSFVLLIYPHTLHRAYIHYSNYKCTNRKLLPASAALVAGVCTNYCRRHSSVSSFFVSSLWLNTILIKDVTLFLYLRHNWNSSSHWKSSNFIDKPHKWIFSGNIQTEGEYFRKPRLTCCLKLSAGGRKFVQNSNTNRVPLFNQLPTCKYYLLTFELKTWSVCRDRTFCFCFL